MKATEAKLLRFLGEKKQFSIPIYQRTYSWTTKQCRQLWDDIVQVANDDTMPAHFIGSIVYINQGPLVISEIPKLYVIDGQQRLTTMTLLMAAIKKWLVNNTQEYEVTPEQIHDDYLYNRHGRGDLKYKLILTRSDHNTLCPLLDSNELPANASTHIVENYGFFEDQLSHLQMDFMKFYMGIRKLMLVDISLDQQDNPQLIFESLNSTGLDLSQADRIRNYVLMRQSPEQQAELYNNYWAKMEESFGRQNYELYFDNFMRDYLTVKSNSGVIPRIDAVYEEFKQYVTHNQQSLSVKEILKDVYTYSNYYVRIALKKPEHASDKEEDIERALEDIRALKVEVAYPFLLEVLNGFKFGLLKPAEVVTIIRLVESYVFRRAICGIPPNSLNKTFATLMSEVNKDNFVESAQVALVLKDSYRRFPRDDEFFRELQVKEVYNFRIRYLLGKLENSDKERINPDEFTVEHIMPQNTNLSEEWKNDLGPDWKIIHARYLNRVGNLTLTGYNSNLSDKPFLFKRDYEKGGFKETHFRINNGLGALDHWNAHEIEKRGKALAKIALHVWPYPSLPDSILQKYKPKQKTQHQAASKEVESNLNTMYANRPLEHKDIFLALRQAIHKMDPGVKETVYKSSEWPYFHVSYTKDAPFLDAVLQSRYLRLILNIPYPDAKDKKRNFYLYDVTGKGYWGGGDVLVGLKSPDQLDGVMELVKLAYTRQKGTGADEDEDV